MDELTPEEEARDEAVFAEFIEDLEKIARGMGLYLQGARGEREALEQRVLVGTDPVVRPFVTAMFTIGDEAFTDRNLHPELYSDEAEILRIEQATYAWEAEEIVKRYQETGELFDA